MADFTNLQIYGVPVLTYGLVGLTTGILAYATATNSIGEVISKSLEPISQITESPMTALTNMNPLAEKEEDTNMEGLNPFANTPDVPPTESEQPSADNAPAPAPSETEVKGGKKRRRRTPKSKKLKRKNKSKKHHK